LTELEHLSIDDVDLAFKALEEWEDAERRLHRRLNPPRS
jgi:hypothetical protein